MSDYFCSNSDCVRVAEYMINLNLDDLDDKESMNQAGWYCWQHVTVKMDEFTKKVAERVSDKGHE